MKAHRANIGNALRCRSGAGLLAFFVVSLVACVAPSVPALESTGRGATDSRSGGSEGRVSAAPRVLRVAFQAEPATFFGGNSAVDREHGDIFNAGLSYYDSAGTLLPKLAVKIPSITDGDWVTTPDGSMEVTWKLRPGLTWHDGAPLSAEDFAFAVQVFKDPASTFAVPRAITYIGDVGIPDPQTIVLRYPKIFNGAAVAASADLPPFPQHLLGGQYAQAGAAGLINSAFWSSGWIGLGPYKMTSHALGSQIEAEAFDGFVWGRPTIDRLIIKYINDLNTLVTGVLAREIDMVPTSSLNAEHAAVLKEQWESAGKGTVGVVQSRIRSYQPQYRDPTMPWASDVRVRQAMLQLIDRQGIVDSYLHGLSTVADMVPAPSNPVYAVLQRRGIPRFPHDPSAAARLLDAAGWPRGADGLRRNATGAVFTHNPSTVAEQTPELLIMVNNFQDAGISSAPDIVPDTATNANERRAQADSSGRAAAADDSFWDRFRISQISAAENRWRGVNTGAYKNAAFEALFDRWVVTLDANARLESEADLHELLVRDVAYLPIDYNLAVYAFRRGLAGPKPLPDVGGSTTSDIQAWILD